jgi:hypothetical protein
MTRNFRILVEDLAGGITWHETGVNQRVPQVLLRLLLGTLAIARSLEPWRSPDLATIRLRIAITGHSDALLGQDGRC